MIDVVEKKVAEFGGQVSPGSIFLSAERHIDEQPALLPYAHYLHQAWRELDLKGVLCVDGKPVSYLCGARSFTRRKKKEQHRFVWNQGLVPLLMFVTPESVEVHSAVKRPEREESGQLSLVSDNLPSLIPTLDAVAETLALARLVRSIETGQFFQDYAAFFPANETVDRCLLSNLAQTARKLEKKNWTLSQAHALLGRAFFVSFLHAREFIKPSYYPDGTTSLLDILSRTDHQEVKRLLYKEFFPRLKSEFNGTMFDTALDDEEGSIEKAHFDILAFFLGRHDVASGQMSLGFDAYDFRFIPVEIISAIYEEFMKGTDPDKQRDEGAYYTPRHLAETVLHVALDGRYAGVMAWKVLDPACGSGIFLVAMFNLIAEQWKRANGARRRQTKAQALLEILQTQIRGVDSNPEACRITAFSLYLALFEKLQPMDVDEFKEKVRQGPFLPSLVWTKHDAIETPVVMQGDFLEDGLPLGHDFDLIIGNPPWESRGRKQIALRFVDRSLNFMRPNGLGCLLLPSPVLVNRHGSLDLDWFKSVTTEKIVQLADFRFVLFEATHPCFILRYRNDKPTLEHVVAYETPKLNRFDRRQGVIVVEPEDQKSVPQREIVQAGLQDKLQAVWSRKFWGTPRDEAFLQRLDCFPRLSQLVGLRGKKKRWLGGTGFQAHIEGRQYKGYTPVPNPWPLTDAFLDAREDHIDLVLFKDQFTTVGKKLRSIDASTSEVLFARTEANFTPPMLIYSKGFTKFAFSSYPVKFFDGLRSITGDDEDADLLRFLAAVFASRLSKYITFHAGSNFGVGRDQLHVYESLNLPFHLPGHDLAPEGAAKIVRDAAKIIKGIERRGETATPDKRKGFLSEAKQELEPLVEAYFSVSDDERILIKDTLDISQPSIHRHGLDGDVPSLQFPDAKQRKRYADTLCATLNRYVRKQGIKICAEGMASPEFNLMFMTIIFGREKKAYAEVTGEKELWAALTRLDAAAKHENGPFSYLRGFSFFEQDRLRMLKPAVLRNWSQTAALNDADAIFEHLAEQDA